MHLVWFINAVNFVDAIALIWDLPPLLSHANDCFLMEPNLWYWHQLLWVKNVSENFMVWLQQSRDRWNINKVLVKFWKDWLNYHHFCKKFLFKSERLGVNSRSFKSDIPYLLEVGSIERKLLWRTLTIIHWLALGEFFSNSYQKLPMKQGYYLTSCIFVN